MDVKSVTHSKDNQYDNKNNHNVHVEQNSSHHHHLNLCFLNINESMNYLQQSSKMQTQIRAAYSAAQADPS